MPTIAHTTVDVTGGVDTHDDVHVAAAVDQAGRLLGWAEFPADEHGYAALLHWLAGHGRLVEVGVEGTGAYGAGLARYLRTHGVKVVEVDRPDRKTRRFQGKSDPIDAEAAARAALAGRATGTPKTRDGQVEALRALHVARRSRHPDPDACPRGHRTRGTAPAATQTPRRSPHRHLRRPNPRPHHRQ